MEFKIPEDDNLKRYCCSECDTIFYTNPNLVVGAICIRDRMMPHPERVFRKYQMSWHSKDWNEFSPWMQIFINARNFSDSS